jgi:5-(carboxyamino)imidazole ribonucleotide mutase
MEQAANILKDFNIAYEVKIISAHRTPQRLYKYAENLANTDIKVVIAGAGGAAHLPGMTASLTHVPVLGVPINTSSFFGVDSLLSIVQMPKGVPVATFALGEAGAKNAALFAVSMLANNDDKIRRKLINWRIDQTESVAETI